VHSTQVIAPGTITALPIRFSAISDGCDATFLVDRVISRALARSARRLAVRRTDPRGLDDHELLVEAEVTMRETSPDLIRRLIGFRLAGNRDGVLLLRGLPLDEPLPGTPANGTFSGSWRDLAVSTMTQLMLMSVLGDVIAYADEKDGHIIQDVCPVPGSERLQENTGSCLLELHSEDGFHPNKPHFLALYCLRADHDRQALTVASGIRAALPALEARHVVALRQPWFRIRVSSSFTGLAGVGYSATMAVLSGAPADPDLCVDFHAMEAITEEGACALAALRSSMLGSLVGMVLEPGDMLIIDNRKAVHGRSDFRPRYDSQDRWLRRCFAVTDIRASDWARPPSSRVHQPLSGIGLISR
jgi:L-asparagine oxygenase